MPLPKALRPFPLMLLIAACAQVDTAGLAPADPSAPPAGMSSFTLAADTRVPAATASRAAVPGQVYDLPSLIDIAQTNNPVTRAAWLRARQAALAVGLVEATYLPRISAEILAGRHASDSTAVNDPLGVLPAGSVATGTGADAAVLSVQWLLFDFGRRSALRRGAQEASFASNVTFVGAHQTLIHDVTQAFYDLQAATQREAIQRQRQDAALEIASMARARREQQVATVTELAQAEQVVAQARFDLTRARSETTAASTRLATLCGLSPRQPIRVSLSSTLALPPRPPAAVDAFLQDALQRRPDLQAAFARARVSEANVAAVEASFRPRIVASATLGERVLSGTIDDSRLGSAGIERSQHVAGVYLGVSIPIWDGNARQLRLAEAQAGHQAALAEAENLRAMAEGEIIAAYEALRASLAANTAAVEMVSTAQTTYDAARSMAGRGLATVGEVDTALRMLYDAQLSRVEAQRTARSSAALLAFASGQIASGR
ncbi:TolC family protein [Pararhodobacter zhoushanensis]|uniref:Protein CyaE n=1 Tax=Pararhodobacter zhoushanensis TaxID=2479545 RepID=A0ABT3H1V8_9RHOB|nr:TolC family protein [Pararhodobacter zhoushanensis]MCW1933756.1 TolC family protein [Pararhodobacter zhoushanensis]